MVGKEFLDMTIEAIWISHRAAAVSPEGVTHGSGRKRFGPSLTLRATPRKHGDGLVLGSGNAGTRPAGFCQTH
jgi:hypothetical protein